MSEEIRQCPVCKVRMQGDTVLFSYGPPGTRERLMSRVCQYVPAKGKASCLLAGTKVKVNEADCYDSYFDPPLPED